MRPKVDLWNDTLTMPFHSFRQRVRRIAAREIERALDPGVFACLWPSRWGRRLKRLRLTRKLHQYWRLYGRPFSAGLAWSRPYGR